MGVMPGEHRVLWECQVSIECDGGLPDDEHLGGVEMSIGHDQHRLSPPKNLKTPWKA